MAKRKISGIINATEHPMNLETPWNQKQPDGTYHAYAGDDIEAFLKKELSNRTPTEKLVSGETKPPTSGTVFDAMVGTVTDVDVQDSEDGTQYVMTVKQKDNQGGESSKEVRFSKYTDDDKVVVNIDLTDSGGAGLPASQTESAARFGYHFGMAFQMCDDLLDLGAVADLDKPARTDLSNGLVYLPSLLLREATGQDLSVFANLSTQELLAALAKAGVLERARDLLREELDAANSELAGLPANPARAHLSSLLEDLRSRAVEAMGG